MKRNHVIEFESKDRILEKAKKYIECVESFLDDGDHAISLLLRAMKHADRDLKREIMFVLGTFAKEEFLWPVYNLMSDPSELPEIRNDAAIQLSVIGPFLKEPQPLINRLLEAIDSPDAERRLHATFALGWKGNSQAAIPFIERLFDSDLQVQQTAINALCNLRDDRILDLLLDRLSRSRVEQKRIILFNLWRFYSKKEKVTQVYLKYLEHKDPDLRFDALVCMGPMTRARDHLDAYRKCLKDKDGRIRELALKRLTEEARASALKTLRGEIGALLNDPNMKVKKAALKLLTKNTE